MKIPTIHGVIDRRILVNYRVAPSVLAAILPEPFRPQLVGGWGIAGICLIRLREIRPRFVPKFAGLSSENAAHRIAVEWSEGADVRRGVYIPRRDTSSRLNHVAGGRLFPGVHHLADFEVEESDSKYRVEMTSCDGSAHVVVDARTTSELPDDSVFSSLQEASAFFEQGALGYSPNGKRGRFDGLELHTKSWQVQPLKVSHVESSFFDDPHTFPVGTAELDCALLMRGIDHAWHSRESICCATA